MPPDCVFVAERFSFEMVIVCELFESVEGTASANSDRVGDFAGGENGVRGFEEDVEDFFVTDGWLSTRRSHGGVVKHLDVKQFPP